MIEKLKYRLSELNTVAGYVAKHLPRQNVLNFIGPMGAGKTTLIKALVENMGVIAHVQSPTFGIINEYPGPIYHFDFYRLDHPDEALDIGVEEYLDSSHLCLIEWGEKIGELLPIPRLDLTIEIVDETFRTLTITEIL